MQSHTDSRTEASSTKTSRAIEATPAPEPSGAAGGDPLAGTAEQDIFDLDQADFLFDTSLNRYLMKNEDGAWDTVKPMEKGALDQMLRGLGLPAKSLDVWKAGIKHVNVRAPFYDRPADIRVAIGSVAYFNTYRPGSIRPAPGNWDNIRALVMNLVGGDQQGCEHLLDWLAAPLQSVVLHGKPMKLGTATVLIGEQGSGKDTLHLLLEHLYGASNVAKLGQDNLDSRFNDLLVDKLFVTANEVISSTNRSMETANKLKMWITDTKIPLEGKHVDAEPRANHFNIMFASNDERPVIIEAGDRRYTVFRSKKAPSAVTTAIYADLGGGKVELAAFFDHLLNRQVAIKYGQLYETEARSEIIRASMSSDQRFAQEVKECGLLPVSAPWRNRGNHESTWNNGAEERDTCCKISRTHLMSIFRTWCENQGVKPVTAGRVYKSLREVVPTIDEGWNHAERTFIGVPYNPRQALEVVPTTSPKTAAQSEEAPSEAGDFKAPAA